MVYRRTDRVTTPLSAVSGIGVCCDLDATISSSYPGTGTTWSNLIASPADGASQTDYDCQLGLDGSTDAPTFVGTAGDHRAYFEFTNGTEYMTFKDLSACLALDACHRTDGANGYWVCAIWDKIAKGFSSGTQEWFWGTDGDAGSPGALGLYSGTGGPPHLQQIDNSGANNIGLFTSDMDLRHLVPQIQLVSWDFTGGGNATIITWGSYDDAWPQTNTSETPGTATANMTTGDADRPFAIGGFGQPDGTVKKNSSEAWTPSGNRLIHFSFGNVLLDATTGKSLIEHLESRHLRQYTEPL